MEMLALYSIALFLIFSVLVGVLSWGFLKSEEEDTNVLLEGEIKDLREKGMHEEADELLDYYMSR